MSRPILEIRTAVLEEDAELRGAVERVLAGVHEIRLAPTRSCHELDLLLVGRGLSPASRLRVLGDAWRGVRAPDLLFFVLEPPAEAQRAPDAANGHYRLDERSRSELLRAVRNPAGVDQPLRLRMAASLGERRWDGAA